MLYLFGFDKVGVVIGDMYFVDPDPIPGQESPERGVRLEVRLLEQGSVDGTIYAARPIAIDRPIWRADLLESVDTPPGSFDRTHHHPHFESWEPGEREFNDALSKDPIPWVGEALSDLGALLVASGMTPSDVSPNDPALLRAAIPEILGVTQALLRRVRSGELGRAQVDGDLTSMRASWL
jgi:hypothetical protein